MPLIVNPERLRASAAEFHRAYGDSLEMVARLSNEMNSLRSEWQGTAQSQFYADFEQWKTQMNQYSDLLESISQALKGMADHFEAADRFR